MFSFNNCFFHKCGKRLEEIRFRNLLVPTTQPRDHLILKRIIHVQSLPPNLPCSACPVGSSSSPVLFCFLSEVSAIYSVLCLTGWQTDGILYALLYNKSHKTEITFLFPSFSLGFFCSTLNGGAVTFWLLHWQHQKVTAALFKVEWKPR